MPGSHRPSLRNKAGAATLTLAAHVFFVAVLLLEKQFGARELPPAQHVVGQWITLSYIPPPPEPEDVTETPVSPRPPVPVPRTSRPDRPSSAITLVSPPPTAPEGPAPQAPPAGVDWHAQAADLAARYAEEVENPATFSPPPAVMRQPCKPRKVSMWPKKKVPVEAPPSWSEVGPTTTMGGMQIGTIGGSLNGGAVGGGGFKIPLGKPEPNKHLFDDMMEGKTPASSVPHHERCD